MTYTSCQISQVFIRDVLVRTTPKTNDFFGQVTAGELRLTGHLFDIPDLSARRQRLKFRGQCVLDHELQVERGDAIFFLPLARLTNQYPWSTFQGLFIQELDMQPVAGVRRFRRVGMGIIRDIREVYDNSTSCNILDDEAWASLLCMAKSDSEERMQPMVIV